VKEVIIMEKDRQLSLARIISAGSSNVAARLAEQEGISRQAASLWLAKAKDLGFIQSEGVGRGTKYFLVQEQYSKEFPIKNLSEDIVWRDFFVPILSKKMLPANVHGIWHYGITELVNNAIDHSGSEGIIVGLTYDMLKTTVFIRDKGDGIFNKIQRELDLYDQREAILELAKGKLTTDPDNHSGEGIFFSSRAFDIFHIVSGTMHFSHQLDFPDFLFQREREIEGTLIYMELQNDSDRILSKIFDHFAVPDEYSFAKTIVPVRLAQYEGEKLVSRSQAKRLTRRFDKFSTVILDFEGVEEIGQGFADEIFRVFKNNHPKITMHVTNQVPAVDMMIKHVDRA
jgi:anti-sigma regulatory factor (Ser/Thr protein kinase)